MEKKENIKRPLNNNHLATVFFALWNLFFWLFVFTHSTMAVILAVFCLMFAIAFKTWYIIREVIPCKKTR